MENGQALWLSQNCFYFQDKKCKESLTNSHCFVSFIFKVLIRFQLKFNDGTEHQRVDSLGPRLGHVLRVDGRGPVLPTTGVNKK